MLTDADYQAFALTLKLAATTTACLLVIGAPLAWWLARTRVRAKVLVEAVVALPLVLPPTVIGFYLLIAFAPSAPLGHAWHALTGHQLAFTFSGLVAGSVVYSLPFVVQPLHNAFSEVPRSLLEAARTMGAGPVDRLLHVVLPMTRRGWVTAASLGFAHTVGEFGVVLMIGGNIPGQTQVLSIALYDRVESLRYGEAHWMAALLVLVSLAALAVLYGFNRRNRVRWQ